MSAGNGKSEDFHIERLVSLVDRGLGAVSQRYPETAQLSARERSEQMDALIAHLDTLTREHNALVKAVDGLMARTTALESVTTDQITEDLKREAFARIDAIERGAAVLSAWVRRPLWERLRAWVGL